MSKEALKKQWTTMYKTTLPSLAKKRSPEQAKWPVYLDHCFARIILDNAVGEDAPWTSVLKAPAVNHMNEGQLKAAVKLGQDIADGKVDLVALDNRSLELRGKRPKGASKKPNTKADTEPKQDSTQDLGEDGQARRKPAEKGGRRDAKTTKRAKLVNSKAQA